MRPVKIVCPKSNTILTIAPSPDVPQDQQNPDQNKPKIVFVENEENASDYSNFWMLKYKSEEEGTFTLEHLLYQKFK